MAISLRTFVLINAHKEYATMPEDEKEFWRREYGKAMRYSEDEESGKDRIKYGE